MGAAAYVVVVALVVEVDVDVLVVVVVVVVAAWHTEILTVEPLFNCAPEAGL